MALERKKEARTQGRNEGIVEEGRKEEQKLGIKKS